MDIFDRAQQQDEFFRKEALKKHFAKNKIATPSESRLAMTNRQCRGCGELIPEKRLKANPEAIRCIACQEKVEKNGERFLAND
jgi:DnaK suppressor protein